jgi:DNA-binding NarL/FixJ family response regulator
MGIRILVCEEHALLQAGIRAVFAPESDIAIIGETSSAREAVTLTARTLPRVVLAGSAVDALAIVSALRPGPGPADPRGPGVIALIAPAEEKRALRALQAGARGVLYRGSSPADLVNAVRTVAAGHAWLTPPMTRRLLDLAASAYIPDAEPDQAAGRLSRTELRILGCLAQGMCGTEIARALGVCDATVRSHVHHLLTKLGLRSRTEAVAFAYRNGLVTGDPDHHMS